MEESKIIKKLLEHDEQFVSIREEISQLRREILQGQDEMMTILRRLDQERILQLNRLGELKVKWRNIARKLQR